jgi:hypothetical protein
VIEMLHAQPARVTEAIKEQAVELSLARGVPRFRHNRGVGLLEGSRPSS